MQSLKFRFVDRMMQVYPTVPSSWYLISFSLTLVMTLILIESTPALQLPAWGIFLAILIALLFLVPVGIISAVSETTIGEWEPEGAEGMRAHDVVALVGLNIVTEFIAGFLIPGKPIANVVSFRLYHEFEQPPVYKVLVIGVQVLWVSAGPKDVDQHHRELISLGKSGFLG